MIAIGRWAGLVSVALLAIAWLASGWCDVEVDSSGKLMGLTLTEGRCAIVISRRSAPLIPARVVMNVRPHAGAWEWRFGSVTHGGSLPRRIFFVPLWCPVLLLGVPTALAWYHRLRRRYAPGHCRSCGYPFAGLAGGSPCPECGSSGSS